MSHAVSAVENDGLLRREPMFSATIFDDIDLPPLDDPSSNEVSTAHLGHLSNQSVGYDRASLKVPQNLPNWTPFVLKRKVLSALTSVFASLVVALAVLFSYSQTHQGLSDADENLYYLWTYGPTAVLSVISAFWVQVIYRTKQLMPWNAMAAAPQSASKSILLDYVSPTALVALIRAISNAHHAVTLSILSSFIMIALTVVSTGLFTFDHVDMTTNNTFVLTNNNFSFENFDWASTDTRPAGLVYATNTLGLKYPASTTAQYAVQDVSTPFGPNTTLMAVVDVFSATLECEPASLILANVSAYSPMGPLFHSGATFTSNISSSSCTVTNFYINSPTMLDANSPWNGTNILDWGYGQLGTCVEDSSQRVLVSVGTYIVHEEWNGTESDEHIGLALPYNQMFQIINSTNILCRPHYSIQPARVVKHINSTSSSAFKSIEPIDGAGYQEDKAHAALIALAVFQSLDDPIAQTYYAEGTSLSYDTFFNIMQSKRPVSSNDSTRQFWHQYDNLRNESNALYQSVAAQTAALKLLAPSNDTIQGQVTENKPRLFVRTLSFALMEAGFVGLIAISTYFFTLTSRLVISHDPGSIQGLAIVLSKSAEIVKQVNGKEFLKSSGLHTALKGNLYSVGYSGEILSSYDAIVSPEQNKNKEEAYTSKRSSSKMGKFWVPFILRIPTRTLVVLCALIYIVILEILWIVNQSHDGIVAIDTNSWLHYGWTYIPALLMVLIGTIYGSATTSIKMISPYAMMRKGPVPANISVQDHSLARVGLHELLVSGKRHQFAVFFGTVAVILASILPIAVSGLYTPVLHGQDIKIHQLTAWNFSTTSYPNTTLLNNTFLSMNQTYPGDPDVRQALPLLTSLIITANLSFPSWTYAELALPLLNASVREGHNLNHSGLIAGSVNVTVPAIRGSLNCSIMPHDKVEVTYSTNYSRYESIGMDGNHGCLNYSYRASGYEPVPDVNCRFARFNIRQGSSLDGCSFDPMLIFLPGHSASSQFFGYFSPTFLRNYTYCPTYVGMFGTLNTTSIENYTWFGCSTEVERVNTQVKFTLPDYTIINASPDEATATSVAVNIRHQMYNNTASLISVNFTGPNSALGENAVNPNQYLNFYNMTDGQNYDNFFSSLVYSRDSVPPSEMLGETNIPRLFAAVQHLWRVVYAQQFRASGSFMSAESRDINAWAPLGPWNGTLMAPNSYRLKQSIVSTRILQGVLAAIALCGIVAFIALGSTNRVLPNEPSSIAVVASLLAGSEMLRMIENRQVDHEGEKEGKKGDPWEGYLFSLGWWDRPDGGRRFGIDIGRADPTR